MKLSGQGLSLRFFGSGLTASGEQSLQAKVKMRDNEAWSSTNSATSTLATPDTYGAEGIEGAEEVEEADVAGELRGLRRLRVLRGLTRPAFLRASCIILTKLSLSSASK